MVFFKRAILSFILKVDALAWQLSTKWVRSVCHSARSLFPYLESLCFYIQFEFFLNKSLSHSLSYEEEPKQLYDSFVQRWADGTSGDPGLLHQGCHCTLNLEGLAVSSHTHNTYLLKTCYGNFTGSWPWVMRTEQPPVTKLPWSSFRIECKWATRKKLQNTHSLTSNVPLDIDGIIPHAGSLKGYVATCLQKK